MDPRWLALIQEQLRSGFADLTGASVAIRLPVSDRLVTQVIAERIPAGSPIRDLQLRAHDGNELTVRARVGGLTMLPALQVRFVIEQQPSLPEAPILTLRLASHGFTALVGRALQFLGKLPTGI